jgi:hypothetical protein
VRISLLCLTVLLVAACGEQTGSEQFVLAATEGMDATGDARETEAAARAVESAATAVTIPERFQGVWASGLGQCGQSADEMYMVLRATDVEFHESGGAVTRVDVEDDLLRFTAELTGEGETWMADLALELSPTGDTLTDTAVGLSRVRCG